VNPQAELSFGGLLRVSTFPGSPGNSIMLCGSRVGEGIWLGKYTIGLKKN